MRIGQTVSVSAFGGNLVSMKVVEVKGDAVYVCKEEELLAAKAENREPIAIGVKLRDIVLNPIIARSGNGFPKGGKISNH